MTKIKIWLIEHPCLYMLIKAKWHKICLISPNIVASLNSFCNRKHTFVPKAWWMMIKSPTCLLGDYQVDKRDLLTPLNETPKKMYLKSLEHLVRTLLMYYFRKFQKYPERYTTPPCWSLRLSDLTSLILISACLRCSSS